MTTLEQKVIFSNNLRRYVERSGKQQKQIANELGVPPTTFHSWYVGKVIPYWNTIQSLAKYFKILPSDLTDEPNTNKQPKLNDHLSNFVARYSKLSVEKQHAMDSFLMLIEMSGIELSSKISNPIAEKYNEYFNLIEGMSEDKKTTVLNMIKMMSDKE